MIRPGAASAEPWVVEHHAGDSINVVFRGTKAEAMEFSRNRNWFGTTSEFYYAMPLRTSEGAAS